MVVDDSGSMLLSVKEWLEDEYYGWHKLQFAGWLWMEGSYPKEMIFSISYFKGDIVYNTEEAE